MSVEGMTPVVTFVEDDSALEPVVKDVRIRTISIEDGKGGRACFDISEIHDLMIELASLLSHDAPAVEVVDLTELNQPE